MEERGYNNMSEGDKQKLKEYQINYREIKKSKKKNYFFFNV